jgi:hypothetical protein
MKTVDQTIAALKDTLRQAEAKAKAKKLQLDATQRAANQRKNRCQQTRAVKCWWQPSCGPASSVAAPKT